MVYFCARSLNNTIYIYTRVALMTPNFTNMAQTTYLHVLIDIFMSAELKKCNESPKKFARTLNFAH